MMIIMKQRCIFLLITVTILFIGCTPSNGEASLIVTPTETLQGRVTPPTLPTDTSTVPLTTEITPTMTTLPDATPVPVTVITGTQITPESPMTSTLASIPTTDTSTRLFEFTSAFGFHYSWLDPITDQGGDIDLTDKGIEPDIVGSATTLAFAHFSNRVAFWYRRPGEPGTLWLADIQLQEATPIYIDDAELFTSDTSFPPRDVSLDWFPNDKYLLVRPINQDALPILVDVSTGVYQPNWSWKCDTVIVSPKTSRLALLCTDNNKALIMEWDGEFWEATGTSDYDILWQWTEDDILPLSPSGSIPPWSPNGSKIAFVSTSEPNTLEVITSLGESLSIPLEVETLFPHTIRWTADGKILVGGYREDWPASWFIIDSDTGEVLWSLEGTIGFNLNPQQQGEQLLLSGDISPSGQYVVLGTSRSDIPSANQLLLIDVKNNQFIDIVADVGHGLDAFVWGR